MTGLIPKLQTACKATILVICACYALSGHHPPAQAQAYVQPVITAEDAGQDHDIASLNRHIEASDATIQRQWSVMQANTNEIAGLRGEERIFSAVIGLLSGGGLLLNFSKRRAV